jgi:hypothetical protein
MTHEQAVEVAARPDIEAEARRNALGEGYGWQPIEAAVCGSDGKTVPIVEILADVAARADARLDRIYDEIAACSGCGGRDWPKDANCPACTDKVDEDIAREAAERDDTPVDAWKRGAEAMGTALLQYCADVNIRDGGVPVALSNLKLPPYQPKVADVMTDTTPKTDWEPGRDNMLARRDAENWDRWYDGLPADLKRRLSLHDFKRLGDLFKEAFNVR